MLKSFRGNIAYLFLLGLVSSTTLSRTAYSQEENTPSGQNQESILPVQGFDLLNLMTFRAGMRLVTSFEELEKSSSGLLFLLGNQSSYVNWPSIDRWVRRGGVLLVAMDDNPSRPLQASIGGITGYQWANLRLLHLGESGIDQLPEHSFAEIQKIVPFEWHIWPKPGINPSSEKTLSGKAHSNFPSFLLPLEGGTPQGSVFATFSPDVKLDVSNGLSLRLAPFRLVFGTQATRGRGRIIQLADPDVFSNQMLELPWNFSFAWSLLGRILNDTPSPTAPFSVMIVGQKVESEVYYLPIPPVPLPDLDPFQLASLAVRVVGEKLPEWESPGGPFDLISRRLSRFMSLGFWVTMGGVALSIFALWRYAQMRLGFHGTFKASKTVKESQSQSGTSKSQSTSKAVLQSWMEKINTGEIPLWELGKLADPNLGGIKAQILSRSEKIQMKSAKQLMDWIARNTTPNPSVPWWAFLPRFMDWIAGGFSSRHSKVELALDRLVKSLDSRDYRMDNSSTKVRRFQEREKE